jgi:steroid delta-isomerase
MTATERIAVCQAYVSGLTEGDLEKVVALFAADATVRDPVNGPAWEGLDAVRSYYDKARLAVLDMVVSGPVGLPEDGSSAAAPVRALVRRPSGELVILESVGVFEFGPDGKITRLNTYYGSSNVRAVPAGPGTGQPSASSGS